MTIKASHSLGTWDGQPKGSTEWRRGDQTMNSRGMQSQPIIRFCELAQGKKLAMDWEPAAQAAQAETD